MKFFTMETLIKTFERFGVVMSPDDLPEILARGVDNFLRKKGKEVPNKFLSELYLIVNEIREQKEGNRDIRRYQSPQNTANCIQNEYIVTSSVTINDILTT